MLVRLLLVPFLNILAEAKSVIRQMVILEEATRFVPLAGELVILPFKLPTRRRVILLL